MAINKVEYIKDSSTTGFAIAGEQKVINKQNAQTIEKDVEENNTQDLTGGQKKYLNNALEGADNTNYENTDGDETTLEDKDKLSNDTDSDNPLTKGKGSNTGAGVKEGLTTMGSMGAAAAGAGMTGMAFAFAQQQGVSIAQVAMNAWAAPIVGGIDLALAAGATVGVAAFDSNYSQRLSEESTSSEYMNTIDEYIQNMDTDIETFMSKIESENAEAPEEPEEPEAPETSGNDINEQLAGLQAELEEAIANGDNEKAEELKAQIEELQQGEGTKSPEKSEEEIANEVVARNSEAHDINDFTTDVATFLTEGNSFGQFGTINAAALAVCTAGSTFLSVLAWRGANLFNTPLAIAGAAMCIAASATFATATGLMTAKTVNEYKCGSSGSELNTKLGELSSRFGDHDKIVEALSTKPEKEAEPETPTETTPTGEGDNTPTPSGGDSSRTVTPTSTNGSSSGGGSSSPTTT